MSDVLMWVEGAEAADQTGDRLHHTQHSIRNRRAYPPNVSGNALRRAPATVKLLGASVGQEAPHAGVGEVAPPMRARIIAGVASRQRNLRLKVDALTNRIFSPRHINFVIAAALVAMVAIMLPGMWLLVGSLIIGLCVFAISPATSRPLMTMLFCVTVGVTSVDYLVWRFEVSNWAGWWIAVPLLLAEAFGALHALGLQYTIWPRPEPTLTVQQNPARMPIYIFIPTVDEGAEILRPTLRAAKIACQRFTRAYPGAQTQIVVCNDGFVAKKPNWRQTEALARQMGVTCCTRTTGGGAKAGNIEYARKEVKATGDALIVIFDADQQPTPEFLLKTIPPFADPTLAWVQTGQYYRNLEHPVSAWANDQQALFYRILCPGKATQNAAFICGTNVVLRAAALDEIGGLPQDSVTEDFAASIQLHGRWRSIFLTDMLAMGLGPMDLPAYLKQQRRWAIGTLGVMRTHWRDIVLPWVGNLSLPQRLQYALACTHYLCGVRDFIYIMAPLAFIVSGVPAVRGATLGLFIWHFLPYWLASQAAFWYACRRQTGLRGIIIGFGSFPALMMSLWTVLVGRKSGFMVTAKHREGARAWRQIMPYVGFLILCLAGLAYGVTSTGKRYDAVVISMLWIGYSAALLSGFLWLAIRDLRYREAPVRGRYKAFDVGFFGDRVVAWSKAQAQRALAPQFGYSLLSIGLLIGSVALTVREMPKPQAPAFTPTVQGHTRYLGLSLRTEMIPSEPASMNGKLCEPFTIIGRTQDIQDNFSNTWADQLARDDATPWIVLEFGQFGADGKPPLDASLLSIANGGQDDNIRRWADEIRAYDKPVYLTILLHDDRNWAVSSAVANGGIPQDSARAWLHTQAIFQQEGARNVAWVWAPADPAHDQAYAPPESSINIVLQSFIRYPNTPWPNVTEILREDEARHPGKPLFVEVSAVGSPSEKSAWLNSVKTSVANDRQVYALFYHEGSPDLSATAFDNAQWSLASDPLSVASVKAWRSLTQTTMAVC